MFLAFLTPPSPPAPNCAIAPAVYAWDGITGNLIFRTVLPGMNILALCHRLSIVGIGDVTGDSGLEIVAIAGRQAYTLRQGGIFIISAATGQILARLHPTLAESGIDNYRPVLVPDADQDGKMEIIFYSDPTDELYLVKGDGTPLSGWPVQNLTGFGPFFSAGFQDPAYADFNDGQGPAIIISFLSYSWPTQSVKVAAFNLNGSVRWAQTFISGAFGNYGKVVVGDVTGDGISEIVIHEADINDPKAIFVRIFDRTGNLLARWPARIHWGISAFSLGDLNNDRINEIIYSDDAKVYVADFKGNFFPGFPRFLWDGQPQPPVYNCSNIPPTIPYCANSSALGVADLNGDGYQDFYIQAIQESRTGNVGDHTYALFAYDRNGATLPGFPYPLKNYTTLPPNIWTWILTNQATYADIYYGGIPGNANMAVEKGFGRIEVISLGVPYKSDSCFPEYGVNMRNTKEVTCTVPPASIYP